MNYDTAFDLTANHEKGYVDDPKDPGGETKFGASKRSYPNEDIPNLTLERVKVLFLRDFWGPARCTDAPDSIRFDLFDTAIHSGPVQAIKLLQRAVGTVEDGILGPVTLRAANWMPEGILRCRFNGVRQLFLAGLSNWDHNSEGWARRIATNLLRV
jgi:lysozyme family protein